MEQLPRVILTIAIVALIIGVYLHMNKGIRMRRDGVNTEARVTSRELHDAFCYVQFKYKAEGRERKGSLRLEPTAKDKFPIGQTFLVRYIPGSPDDVSPDSTADNSREMYYFGLFAATFAIYFVTKSMFKSYRPNFE